MKFKNKTKPEIKEAKSPMMDETPVLMDETTIETTVSESATQTVEVKKDTGKPRIDLVPLKVLVPLARVREYGLKKYGMDGIDNWRNIDRERLRAARLRHEIQDDHQGAIDEESGLPASWLVLMNAAFIAIQDLEAMERGEL